jgi:hypothetical protein
MDSGGIAAIAKSTSNFCHDIPTAGVAGTHTACSEPSRRTCVSSARCMEAAAVAACITNRSCSNADARRRCAHGADNNAGGEKSNAPRTHCRFNQCAHDHLRCARQCARRSDDRCCIGAGSPPHPDQLHTAMAPTLSTLPRPPPIPSSTLDWVDRIAHAARVRPHASRRITHDFDAMAHWGRPHPTRVSSDSSRFSVHRLRTPRNVREDAE